MESHWFRPEVPILSASIIWALGPVSMLSGSDSINIGPLLDHTCSYTNNCGPYPSDEAEGSPNCSWEGWFDSQGERIYSLEFRKIIDLVEVKC